MQKTARETDIFFQIRDEKPISKRTWQLMKIGLEKNIRNRNNARGIHPLVRLYKAHKIVTLGIFM